MLHKVRSAGFSFFVLGLACACAGGKSEAESPRVLQEEGLGDDGGLVAPTLENVQAPMTQLDRGEVVQALDAGFVSFLQDFSTEPSFTAEGGFQGFRIVRIFNRKKYEGLGIGQGDVVTRINGLPIERPEQGHQAFHSLRTAKHLDVEYLRGGHPMRLSLPIVGPMPTAPQAAATTSTVTAPATGGKPVAPKTTGDASSPSGSGK